MSLPHFWSTVRQKRSRFEHMQTMIQTSRRLNSFLREAAQNFELTSKYSRSKIKNKKPMSFSRPIQRYHSHADPIWPDGIFNWTRHAREKQREAYRILVTFVTPNTLFPPSISWFLNSVILLILISPYSLPPPCCTSKLSRKGIQLLMPPNQVRFTLTSSDEYQKKVTMLFIAIQWKHIRFRIRPLLNKQRWDTMVHKQYNFSCL